MTFCSHFAIRDDDLSYWSDPSEIDRAYGEIFQLGVKVSFATIPCSIQSHFKGDEKRFYVEKNSERAIGENYHLVEYIRELIRSGRVEIMLHGYNHTYGYYDGGVMVQPFDRDYRPNNVKWVAECTHKSLLRMHDEIHRGRDYLESVFDTPVTVFVPPSNDIGRVVRDLSMDLCSATPKLRDRGIRRGFFVWLRQKYFRLVNGYTYPGVTFTQEHREITAISLASKKNKYDLTDTHEKLFSDGFPVIMATHYWELLSDSAVREKLFHAARYALDQNRVSSFVSELLDP